MKDNKIQRFVSELFTKYREVLMYLIFGVLTTAVSIVTYWFFTEVLNMPVLIANVISWILAVTFAYFTNRTWVFEQKPEGFKETVKQMIGFYGGRVATLLMEEVILWLFIEQLGWNNMLVKLFAQVLVIVLNYVISKLLVFRKKEI